MKEAKIECVINEYPIHDLGITLKFGQIEFIERAKARQSKDLKEARRIGAVRVEFIERSRMAKKPGPPPRLPPPPNVRLKRGDHRRTPPPAVPGIDMDEIRRIAREEARAGSREGVLEALETLQTKGPTIDQDTLEAALRNVLPGITVSAPVASSSAPATLVAPVSDGPTLDEPVFIPKSIVNKTDKTEIKTTTVEGDDAGLGEAAAALKAAKGAGARKKRTRKKPKE